MPMSTEPTQNNIDNHSTKVTQQPNVCALTDEEIIDRVQLGDTGSYELIMRRYNQRLFRIVRSIINDDHETEDILQEAYVRAYEHLDQFDGRAKFSTWLTKIAIHDATARKLKRQRMNYVEPTDLEIITMHSDQSTTGVDHSSNTKELNLILSRGIDQLPSELRTVFMMRSVQELNTHETAECLGLSESSVKTRLHRGRTLLRSWMDREIGAEARKLYQFDGERCDRMVKNVLERIELNHNNRRQC